MTDDIELVDFLMQHPVEGPLQAWLTQSVRCSCVERSPTEASLRYRQINALYAYWNAQTLVDGVAEVDKVDPLDLAPALGSLMLLDVIDGGADFRYALYGSRIATLSGFDMTGKRLSELPTDSPIQSFFRAGYRGIVKYRQPLFTIHEAPDNIMIGHWHRYQVPLGHDGVVERILVCNVGTRPNGELK